MDPLFINIAIVFIYLSFFNIKVTCVHTDHNFTTHCNSSVFFKCTDILMRDEQPLPTTKEELAKGCSELAIAAECFDKQSAYCLTSEQILVYDELLNGTRTFLNDICKEGKIQEDYLKYSTCYKNVSSDDRKCARQLKDAILTPTQAKSDYQSEYIIEKSCCALQRFLQCQSFYVNQDCGKDASVFNQKHLDKVTNSMMSKHCSAYTYGPEACKIKNLAKEHYANASISSSLLFSSSSSSSSLFLIKQLLFFILILTLN